MERTTGPDKDKHAPAHNAHYEPSRKEQAVYVWQMRADGRKLNYITDQWKQRLTRLAPSESTADRYWRITKMFDTGDSDENIAKRINGWSVDFIGQVRHWWEDFHMPPAKVFHVNTLLALAAKIRERIIPPNNPEKEFFGKSIWQYADQEWRPVPGLWVHVVVPVLVEPFWPGLSDFKAHTNGYRLWTDYSNLEQKAHELEVDYETIMPNLEKHDPALAKQWKDLREELDDWAYREGRPDYAPGHNNVGQLPYDEELGARMANALMTYFPNFEKRLESLEVIVQKLWADLDPNAITSDIEKGRCEHCPAGPGLPK